MSVAAAAWVLALATALPELPGASGAAPAETLVAPSGNGAGRGASAPDAPCGQGLDARQRRLLSSPHQQLAFVTQPARLAVGRHFSIDIVVCPGPGRPQPVALRVDAEMPAHRHGMNYRASVHELGDGRYRAEGLLLHMPGRWRLLFDLGADGRVERLSHELELE